MVHWTEYLREAKGELQLSFGIAQSDRCSTRNSMDMELYIGHWYALLLGHYTRLYLYRFSV
jgi:hypothetical protein